MIARGTEVRWVEDRLRQFPVVAVVGARQVGKTTLARIVADRAESATFLDLERRADLARLDEPMLALEPLRGLVVLDEIQRRPDLFPTLRVLADRDPAPARFLILGSASPDLLRQSSETLAGRIAYHDLGGLALDEVGSSACNELWLRGGFPRSFLAADDRDSSRWREQFIRTYLERDLSALGFRLPSETMRRFLTMLAHRHASTWQAAPFARSLDVSEGTIRRWLDVLCSTFLVRRLSPWLGNAGKRLVKSPKVYLTDSGLAHALLGIETTGDLLGHPKLGDSWEGFAIVQVVRRLEAAPSECHFWAVHTGAELDLLVVRGMRRRGFEIKFTDAPRSTKSMHAAIAALDLDRIDVIHAGADTFPISSRIRAVALRRIHEDLEPL